MLLSFWWDVERLFCGEGNTAQEPDSATIERDALHNSRYASLGAPTDRFVACQYPVSISHQLLPSRCDYHLAGGGLVVRRKACIQSCSMLTNARYSVLLLSSLFLLFQASRLVTNLPAAQMDRSGRSVLLSLRSSTVVSLGQRVECAIECSRWYAR